MNHRTRRLHFQVGVLLPTLLLLLCLSSLTHTAFAAEYGWKENIELTGTYTGTFNLDSNTSQIFRVDNAAPGDEWNGQITILNKAGGPMEVALLSIVSVLDDLDMYNALTLDISVGQEQIYSGSYGTTPTPITPFYVVPAGTAMVLDVTVGLPATVGNEMMGKKMDSNWTFEARYLGDGPGPALYPYTVEYIDADTGTLLAESKHAYAPYGTEVTEYALEFAGYTPDAPQKTITIKAKDNLIVFYYEVSDPGTTPDLPSGPDTPSGPQEPDPTPSDPEAPPSDDKPENVQTGTDLSTSNTTSGIYLIAVILCTCAILLTVLRIRRMKKQEDAA